MTTKKLKPYDYINSTDGDTSLMDVSLQNTALDMDIYHALMASIRVTRDLIQRHESGEIVMTNNEYNELKNNYEEMKAIINDNK